MRNKRNQYALVIIGALNILTLLSACKNESQPQLLMNESELSIRGNPPSLVADATHYYFKPQTVTRTRSNVSFDIKNAPEWSNFDKRTGTISGTPTASHVGKIYNDIQILASDGKYTASLDVFSIEVTAYADGYITLSWTPPTQNDDGSRVTGLNGYNIYYGFEPDRYSYHTSVRRRTTVTKVIDNLSPNRYWLSVTAVTAEGSESAFSTPIEFHIR